MKNIFFAVFSGKTDAMITKTKMLNSESRECRDMGKIYSFIGVFRVVRG